MYTERVIVLLLTVTGQERQKLNEWILSVAQGDRQALSEIYRLAGGRMLSVAMGLVRDRAAAEDILHDSFVKVVRFSHQFKPHSNGYAWLCTIVRNTAYNKLKSETIRRGEDIDNFFHLQEGRDHISRSENAMLIEHALKQLSPKERTVIWLKYYNDMTIRMIAKELDMPRSTVQGVVSAAEQKLKKVLSETGQNPGLDC